MFIRLRTLRRRYFRPRLIIVVLTTLLILDYLLTTSLPPSTRTSTLPAHLAKEKIFIVSIHRNSEYMLRLYWSSALLSLVEFLGPQNVFVSILESGSLDNTKGALQDLDANLKALGVGTSIVLGESVDEQRESLRHVPPEDKRDGWIWTGREKGSFRGVEFEVGDRGWEKRRIPHLAELRNRAMEPLDELMEKGKQFRRVLWINDVVFTNEDVATLLATNDGQYAAACAMDFSGSADTYYDTFALRDSSGLKTGTEYYPYFLSRPSLQSTLALQPIPLQSCWNGLISMDAAPYYRSPPLRFRGISDSLAKEHLEGSECCLIHSDNHVLRSRKGVWMNPNVRVTYNATTYVRVNPQGPLPESITEDLKMKAVIEEMRWQRWPDKWELWTGTWRNRRARWVTRMRFWSEHRMVEKRVLKWISKGKEKGEKREESALECLVNEMQVMVQNGWQHV